MAITRGNDPKAVIELGKFILSGSSLTYGICGKSGRITSISGKRIYYERLNGDEASQITHINDDKIAFVCDTADEVDSLLAVSNESVAATSVQVQQIESKNRDYYKARIEALIAGVS